MSSGEEEATMTMSMSSPLSPELSSAPCAAFMARSRTLSEPSRMCLDPMPVLDVIQSCLLIGCCQPPFGAVWISGKGSGRAGL